MKIFNKICSLALFSAALVMGACTDDVERGESPVVGPNCNTVYFPNSNISGKLELAPEDPTQLTITVNRQIADSAISVPVQVVSNTENVFTGIPATVDFAAGSASTSFTINFDNAELIKEYTLSLRLVGEHADPYTMAVNGSPLYSLYVQRIKWISEGEGLGEGIFYYSFFSGSSSNILEHGEGTNMYRIQNWGNGSTLTFFSNNESNTKFTVPEQTINYVHPDYGDIYVSGSVEFDEEYTYKFKLDYHVTAGSFGEFREKFILDHPVDPSQFQATITVDPAESSVNFIVTPDQASSSIQYFVGLMGSVAADMTDEQISAEYERLLKEMATQEGMSLPELLGYMLQIGNYSDTFEDLAPGETYYILAWAMDPKTAELLSPIVRQSFETVAAGEPTQEYLDWLGTYRITSEKTLRTMDDDNNTQTTEGPVSFDIEIKERVANYSYEMDLWTINKAVFGYETEEDRGWMKASYDPTTNAVGIMSGENLGDAGDGYSIMPLGYYSAPEQSLGIGVITGDYAALVLSNNGGLKLEGQGIQVSSGETLDIIGLDIFAVNLDAGRMSVWYSDENNTYFEYAVGPYTVEKIAEPAAVVAPTMRTIYDNLPIRDLKNMQLLGQEKPAARQLPGKIGMQLSSVVAAR